MIKSNFEYYIITIIAFIMLLISIIFTNLINYTILKVLSYLVLSISLIIVCYGIHKINKTYE